MDRKLSLRSRWDESTLELKIVPQGGIFLRVEFSAVHLLRGVTTCAQFNLVVDPFDFLADLLPRWDKMTQVTQNHLLINTQRTRAYYSRDGVNVPLPRCSEVINRANFTWLCSPGCVHICKRALSDWTGLRHARWGGIGSSAINLLLVWVASRLRPKTAGMSSSAPCDPRCRRSGNRKWMEGCQIRLHNYVERNLIMAGILFPYTHTHPKHINTHVDGGARARAQQFLSYKCSTAWLNTTWEEKKHLRWWNVTSAAWDKPSH